MTIATGDNDRITLAAITQQQKVESLVWKTRKISICGSPRAELHLVMLIPRGNTIDRAAPETFTRQTKIPPM